MPTSADVSRLLERCRAGDEAAFEALLPLVYEDLRHRAAQQLKGERRAHTLQPTALVHEAYLNLVQQENRDWENRRHFLALAATAMRRVLLHHAEKRAADKRVGRRKAVTLDDSAHVTEGHSEDLIDLDQALSRLALIDLRAARVVELRFFGGLEIEEVAGILEVSARTVERDWRIARAWLAHDLGAKEP